jgi:hypothetical protein
LYPGERIGQLTVEKLTDDEIIRMAQGDDGTPVGEERRRRTKYNRQIGPVFSSFAGDAELPLLEDLSSDDYTIDLTDRKVDAYEPR